MLDGMAGAAQIAHQLAHQRERIAERLEVGDLAADVHVNAGNLDAGQLGSLRVEAGRIVVGHAELVLGLAGGNFGVGLRIHVRVDAQGDAGRAAEFRRDFAQRFQLGLRLDVEAPNALAQGVGHLVACLAHACKDDAIGGHACSARAAELAFRHHVHAGAQTRQGGNDRLVGVGLDGVADEGVEPGECLLEHAVMPLESGGAVAIEGGADFVGNARKTHVLRVEDPAAVAEMVHGGTRQRINGSRTEGLWGTG